MRLITLALIGIGLVSGAVMGQPALQPTNCRDGLDALAVNDFKTASDQLTTCLTLDLPNPVRAFVLRARAEAYRGLNNLSAAIEDQKASLQIERPFEVWPLINLAAYHRAMKQYPAALGVLQQALAYDENGPGSGPGVVVFYHTGLTLNAMRRHRDAIDALDKALAKKADYGFAYFERSLAFEALTDHAQAKQNMAKAGELIAPSDYYPFVLRKFREYGVPPKPQAR